VQASADDPQVVEYAVRRLAKLASGVAVMRWAQMGFTGGFKHGETGRNQMGFKDGTLNADVRDPKTMNRFVWVGEEGPAWLRQGSYMVIRPIRIALDHWDDMKVSFQEQSVGRHKDSGAPIGKVHEKDALELDRLGKDGMPVISEDSHAALSAPENNDGAQILRRAFNYDNGIARIAERWPPWRQLVTFDAGLLFQCYQKDPRTGFTKLFSKMSQIDMLNQFTTHTGSAVFACPPGAKPGEFIGQELFA
jgi:deferrochelatase/peroxidase EfeB